MEFVGASLPLSKTGFQKSIDLLGTGAPEMWTLLAVETHGCGFLPDRRPVILFERHIFRKQTKGAFDASHPSISSPDPGGYLGGAAEYERLQQAVGLNRDAALKSASWGIGQVMGFNSNLAGFPSVEAMVEAMVDSEDSQLAAVANFLRAQNLHAPLAGHDWAKFARGYNGPAFQKNQYDTRLAGTFASYSGGAMPKIDVRQVQVLLTFLGVNVGSIDGILGKRTRSAVVEFKGRQGLGSSEVINEALITALMGKAVPVRSRSASNLP